MEIQIELLIDKYKHEASKYDFNNKNVNYLKISSICWIILRIMDYFYTITINGEANRTAIYYCEFLVKSSLMRDYNYNSLTDLINDLKLNEIHLTNDIENIMKKHEINLSLNLYDIINVLEDCKRFTKYFGGGVKRKSRRIKK